MNNYKRRFIASSELFSGYSTYIDIQSVSTLEDICEQFKKDLKDVLNQHHFENLLRKLDDCRFHIHSYTIEDILISDLNDLFYICDHC